MDDDEFDWQGACAERELQQFRWSDVANRMEYFTFREGLYGAVDTVHLMQVLEYCVILATISRSVSFVRGLHW